MRDVLCAACGAFIATLDDRLFPMPPESWCRDCSMPAYARLRAMEGPPPDPPVAIVRLPPPAPQRGRILARRGA